MKRFLKENVQRQDAKTPREDIGTLKSLNMFQLFVLSENMISLESLRLCVGFALPLEVAS